MTVARYDTELVHPESREKGPFDLIWRGTFTLPTHNFQPHHGNNKMPNVPSQRKFLTTLIKNLTSTQSAHTSSVAEGSSHLPPASRPARPHVARQDLRGRHSARRSRPSQAQETGEEEGAGRGGRAAKAHCAACAAQPGGEGGAVGAIFWLAPRAVAGGRHQD